MKRYSDRHAHDARPHRPRLRRGRPDPAGGAVLDRTGKNIRARVETEIAKGRGLAAEERDVLHRIARRIEWDKRFTGATIRFESRAGGTIVLTGSVPSPQVKLQAVELVQNTVGVTTVVDELAIVAGVRVIRTKPSAATTVEVAPSAGPETTVTVKP